MTRRVDGPTIERLGVVVDDRANWNTWAAIRASHDRTRVVGSRVREVHVEPQTDNETWIVRALAWVFGVLIALVLLV